MKIKETLPSVQVLLATCNGITFLPDQFDSIMNQSNVRVSLLCSDDISTDGTFEYLEEKASQYSNIQLLPRHKSGSAGRNFYHLIQNANFIDNDFIAFADHDDIWNHDKLENAVELLKSKKCIAYSSSFIAFWDDDRKRYVNKAGRSVKFDFLFSSPGPGCTFVIDSKVLMQFKDYFNSHTIGNEICFHDWLIYAWIRAMYPSGWIIDSRSFILYRQHNTNVIGVNHGVKALKKRISLISKNWYSEEIGKILVFLKDTDSYESVMSLFRKGRVGFAIESFQMRRKILDSVILFFLIVLNYIDHKKISSNCLK